MSVADKLFPPTRRIVATHDDGRVTVGVTAPSFMHLPEAQVTLTGDQFKRYLDWRCGDLTIDRALPDLTPEQREVLQSGIGPDDWDRLYGGGDDNR